MNDASHSISRELIANENWEDVKYVLFSKERLDRSGVADDSQEGTAKLQRVLWVPLSVRGSYTYFVCVAGYPIVRCFVTAMFWSWFL